MEQHDRALTLALQLIDNKGWTELTEILARYSKRLVKEKTWRGVPADTVGLGSEPLDFVHTAFKRFFEGERRWSPDTDDLSPERIQGALLGFFLGVVKSLVYHESQLIENRITVRPSSGSSDTENLLFAPKSNEWDTAAPRFRNQEEELQFKEECEQLRARCAADPLLMNIIELIVHEDGRIRPRDIAWVLGVEVQEVYNALKRARRTFIDLKEVSDADSTDDPQLRARST